MRAVRLALCMCAFPAGAQPVQHRLYAVYGDGPSVLTVYDLDNGFAQLGQPVSIATAKTTNSAGIVVRGVVADAAAGMLYVSHGCPNDLSVPVCPATLCCTGGAYLAKYDFVHNTLVWDRSYNFGVDAFSITPDGKTIYLAGGEGSTSALWHVINTASGSAGVSISAGTGPHNTLVGNDGSRVYLGSVASGLLAIASTATNAVVKNVGPTLNTSVRPFTVDSAQAFTFTESNGLTGFQVGDTATGNILFTASPPVTSYPACSSTTRACSHGISLSPDDREIYLGVRGNPGNPNDYIHVFDVTGLPGTAPKYLTTLVLPDGGFNSDSWVTHTRDGRYVFAGGNGAVIDTASRSFVGWLPALWLTNKYTEIDFQNGVPVFAPLSMSGVGYGATDAGSGHDAGSTGSDAGRADAGAPDAGQSADAGVTNADSGFDAGIHDGGQIDAGTDAGETSTDAGTVTGTGCSSAPAFGPGLPILLALLVLTARRRRDRES
jgi:MYXO-CTERM domain-containing protein